MGINEIFKLHWLTPEKNQQTIDECLQWIKFWCVHVIEKLFLSLFKFVWSMLKDFLIKFLHKMGIKSWSLFFRLWNNLFLWILLPFLQWLFWLLNMACFANRLHKAASMYIDKHSIIVNKSLLGFIINTTHCCLSIHDNLKNLLLESLFTVHYKALKGAWFWIFYWVLSNTSHFSFSVLVRLLWNNLGSFEHFI